MNCQQKIKKELILVLGGAQCGKSIYVQKQAEKINGEVLYIATATPDDKEMEVRITDHRVSRPSHWKTLEIQKGVGLALKQLSEKPSVIILDCLTLLVSNLMTNNNISEKELLNKTKLEIDSILDAYNNELNVLMYIISNEVGMGVVPAYYTGRIYRNVLGKVNQYIAEKANKVIFLIAGIPTILK